MKNIISISGTSRPDNYTARSLAVVNDELSKHGVNPVLFDARKLTLTFPGHPETKDAQHLRTAIKGAAGVVFATPEYHGSFCAMTKLIIENLGFPSALSGKPVALLGVAAGRIGAIKSLEQLRGVCSHIGAIVVPGAVSIAGIRNVFNAEGNCVDAEAEKALRRVALSLLDFLKEFIYPKQALEAMVRGEERPWSATV
jgi:NAD(P)H-dependent FMN reductase